MKNHESRGSPDRKPAPTWIVLLAVAAFAAGAAATLLSRRHHHRRLAHAAHKADIKSWENEGGNLAPAAP